ncbi:MAG: hypothetical protein AAB451_03100 [Patescibacteria group bacterium]
MNDFKKIITLNNLVLLILLFFGGYFFWNWQKKVTPILIPVTNLNQQISFERFTTFLAEKGIFPEKVKISDPQTGNSGDVDIFLKKTKDSIELSWPKEYQPYFLILKNLGTTDKTDDNNILLGFTSDKPQNRYFPKTGPVVIERTKIESPLIINPSFTSAWKFSKEVSPFSVPTVLLEFKNGEKYLVEIIFEKGMEDKIYIGILSFKF